MKVISSPILPLPRRDIDTDLIIPANFLHTTDKKNLGEHVFESLRCAEPNFPFNQECYRKAKILVTGKNFGCGSSREHAAWALSDWGIEVILAPSFADIFYNNAIKNKILPIRLDSDLIEQLFKEESLHNNYNIEVDLPAQTITLPSGEKHSFEIKSYVKTCLMEDIDDFDYLIKHLFEIQSFKKTQRKNIFFNIRKV